MNVRVIKYADGVSQNKVASLGVTGLSLSADNSNVYIIQKTDYSMNTSQFK